MGSFPQDPLGLNADGHIGGIIAIIATYEAPAAHALDCRWGAILLVLVTDLNAASAPHLW